MKIIVKDNINLLCTCFIIISVASGLTVFAGYQLSKYYDILTSNSIMQALSEAFILIGWWILSVFTTYCSTVFQAFSLKRINLYTRKRISEKIVSLNECEFLEHSAGYYSSWLLNDVVQIETNTIQSVFKIMEAVLLMLFSLFALCKIHIVILIITLLSSFVLILIPKLFSKKIEKAATKVSKVNEEYSEKVTDSIQGFETFILHNCKRNLLDLLSPISDKLENSKFNFNRKQAGLAMLSSILFRIFELSTIIITALLVISSQLNVGAMFSVSNLATKFLNSATDFFKFLVLYKSTSDILMKFMYLPSSLSQEHESLIVKEGLNIQNVSLHYSGEYIFKNKSFTFKIHNKYAIIGESGCGKTSILKMLMRIHKSYDGTIQIDDVNLSSIPEESLYETIAYIPQNPYMFQSTVRFNLTLGYPYSDEEIYKVLAKVNLQSFIKGLPAGIDGRIESNATNISGGQKQRIAIARELLRKKSIYLVDECTSSLDRYNAEIIQKIFLEDDSITLIFVTHQVDANIENQFDYVYRMDQL